MQESLTKQVDLNIQAEQSSLADITLFLMQVKDISFCYKGAEDAGIWLTSFKCGMLDAYSKAAALPCPDEQQTFRGSMPSLTGSQL